MGFNLFLPESMNGTYMANFLAMLNIFGIWQYALLGIGLSVVAGISSRKSYIGVFTLFILFSAAMAAMMPKTGM